MTPRRWRQGTGLALALLLCAPVAGAQDLSSLQLGAETDRVRAGDLLYVALARGGVAVVDVSQAPPRLVRTIAEDRRPTKLLLTDGTLYLFELKQEVTTFSLADARNPAVASPAAPPATAAPPGAVAPAPPAVDRSARREAKVLEVRDGRVLLDAGTAAGYVPGARVRILSQQLVSRPDLLTGLVKLVPSGDVTAVALIEQAEEERSMARLGRGDLAQPGDRASLTGEPLSERLFLPRRAPFSVLVGFQARPFLGLEASDLIGRSSKPVGLLVDAYATYYLEGLPVALSASLAPVGLVVGSAEAHYPGTLAVTAAYATDYFELGLGAGALVGNPGPCLPQELEAGGACEINTGFTINQSLRLGALDGLNVTWRSSIFSRPDRFVFGVGRSEVNVPISSTLGLFGGGGGGENGWAYGEFGVRTYMGGTGDRGTLILSASLGYASVFDGPSRETVAGPSVALGMEWRR